MNWALLVLHRLRLLYLVLEIWKRPNSPPSWSIDPYTINRARSKWWHRKSLVLVRSALVRSAMHAGGGTFWQHEWGYLGCGWHGWNDRASLTDFSNHCVDLECYGAGICGAISKTDYPCERLLKQPCNLIWNEVSWVFSHKGISRFSCQSLSLPPKQNELSSICVVTS